MGGYSSGRYRTKNRGAVEMSLRLDMRILKRRGFISPGARTSGLVSWTCRGETSGSIWLEMDLTSLANCFAVLRFAVGGEPRTQTVVVEAVPCQFGGHRYFFHCPRRFDRCVVLCGVDGYFASRDAHRLTYQSQSEAPPDRAIRAREKAEARAFGKDGYPKPRGPNRERLVERWIAAEELAEDLFEIRCAGVLARLVAMGASR